jgi:hypothetical protein
MKNRSNPLTNAGASTYTRNRAWILGLVLVLATAVAYQQARHAGHAWDDDIYVTGNISGGVNPVIIATLSAAYAETGGFHEAVRTAQRALDLATATDNTALANLIKPQIALYEAGIPSREAPNGPRRR